MPKSKRARIVHLSQVQKKGKAELEKLHDDVQEATNTYAYVYVFAVDNMRNAHLQEVRADLASDSR